MRPVVVAFVHRKASLVHSRAFQLAANVDDGDAAAYATVRTEDVALNGLVALASALDGRRGGADPFAARALLPSGADGGVVIVLLRADGSWARMDDADASINNFRAIDMWSLQERQPVALTLRPRGLSTLYRARHATLVVVSLPVGDGAAIDEQRAALRRAVAGAAAASGGQLLSHRYVVLDGSVPTPAHFYSDVLQALVRGAALVGDPPPPTHALPAVTMLSNMSPLTVARADGKALAFALGAPGAATPCAAALLVALRATQDGLVPGTPGRSGAARWVEIGARASDSVEANATAAKLSKWRKRRARGGAPPAPHPLVMRGGWSAVARLAGGRGGSARERAGVADRDACSPSDVGCEAVSALQPNGAALGELAPLDVGVLTVFGHWRHWRSRHDGTCTVERRSAGSCAAAAGDGVQRGVSALTAALLSASTRLRNVLVVLTDIPAAADASVGRVFVLYLPLHCVRILLTIDLLLLIL